MSSIAFSVWGIFCLSRSTQREGLEDALDQLATLVGAADLDDMPEKFKVSQVWMASVYRAIKVLYTAERRTFGYIVNPCPMKSTGIGPSDKRAAAENHSYI